MQVTLKPKRTNKNFASRDLQEVSLQQESGEGDTSAKRTPRSVSILSIELMDTKSIFILVLAPTMAHRNPQKPTETDSLPCWNLGLVLGRLKCPWSMTQALSNIPSLPGRLPLLRRIPKVHRRALNLSDAHRNWKVMNHRTLMNSSALYQGESLHTVLRCQIWIRGAPTVQPKY